LRVAIMPFFAHDTLEFHYQDAGSGLPFVFQHGLGNQLSQGFELFPPRENFRLLAFDCRGHGATSGLGVRDKLSIDNFADDLAVFLDRQNIAAAVIGGTSLGAALSLNFALRYPTRVLGLVLSRPAWLDQAMPQNLRVLGTVAGFLRRLGAADGRRAFQDTADYRETLCESAASASSLLWLFEHSRPADLVELLERIPGSRPCANLNELRSISVPTLVMANRIDSIHPLEYGLELAARIASSEFREVTPRAVSEARHRADVDRHLTEFLEPLFLTCG
jgi:pimeloyl-ACP methyl ester carboxylesterase